MDNEKEFLENEENVEETVSEVTEEVADAVETAEGNFYGVAEGVEGFSVPEIPAKQPMSKGTVAFLSAAITFVCCAAIAVAAYFICYNPYNANKFGYEITLAEMAEYNGQTPAEFKEAYGFPSDMRDDTMISILQDYQKLGKVAEQYGMSFEELKKALNVEDNENITEESFYGEITRIQFDEEMAKKRAEKSTEAPTEAATEATTEAPVEATTEAPTEAVKAE